MDKENLPLLIIRCLAFGIKIYPYKLSGILRKYDQYLIPGEVLLKMEKAEVERYCEGLYLSSCESARDWTKGHEILKELGFEKKERVKGHRVFIRLEWVDNF